MSITCNHTSWQKSCFHEFFHILIKYWKLMNYNADEYKFKFLDNYLISLKVLLDWIRFCSNAISNATRKCLSGSTNNYLPIEIISRVINWIFEERLMDIIMLPINSCWYQLDFMENGLLFGKQVGSCWRVLSFL